jgi:hypothetical protein
MSEPRRIQLRRTKGWRLPPKTVVVARPGPWGNPFIAVPECKPGMQTGSEYVCVPNAAKAVACFEEMLRSPNRAALLAAARATLGGKNLACWCRLDQPCHADVLLKVANE